ncbi:glycosyltransferase family protein [Chloroflexus aggregans]|uniref:Glycosyltransferase RgtA/B/C/D-like domain-containing protein n=1 Tax=Chloroflexus aggregans (strain MD-66 / DSM 9485) TaxID=326427 RepID=B8G5L7_CHLAD|nr:hypothetical protein [Chloroflexus aggregans]ACL23728.1 conserved hypothetical protein [Chloroflexus aggregans DSM 9485]
MAITQPKKITVTIQSTARRLLIDAAEWRFYGWVILGLLIVIWAPIVFAFVTAPPDRQFMGVIDGVPDHNQYFAWMRSFTTANLAANRLTPEPNEPAFFNLLWWVTARLSVITGVSYIIAYTILRLVAILSLIGSLLIFLQLMVDQPRQRQIAFWLICTSSGLGVIWIVIKYLVGLPEAPFPISIYTVEPNTLMIMQAFPHFTMALALIITIFSLMWLGWRKQQLRYAIGAGIVGAVLALQHAYDLLIVYSMLGLFGLLIWWRDRRFPSLLFQQGVILVFFSAPGALYLAYLVANEPIWGRKLEQFDNAGVFTPNPALLVILLGVPFVLALAGLRRRMFRSADDRDMLIAAWFVVHFVLMYLPLKFQIHMLLGVQVPMVLLATRYLDERLIPALRRGGRYALGLGVAAVFGLSIVTSVYIQGWRFVYLARYEQPHYLTNDELAALQWLQQHTTADDVVLADIELGQFVPVWSDARAYIAHWAGTLNFFSRRDNARTVLDPTTSSDQRQRILAADGVSYVVMRDRDGSRTALSQDNHLVVVYENATVSVYRVRR